MAKNDIKTFYCLNKEYFFYMERCHDYNFYLPIIKLLKEKKIILKNKKILDVGSGTGKFLRILGKEFKNEFRAFGTDISIQGKKFHKGIHFIQADAHNLPWEKPEFDIVFCIDVLPSVKDYKKVIREIYRITNDGGYIILRAKNFLPYFPIIKINDLLELVKKIFNIKSRERNKELIDRKYNELLWASSRIYSPDFKNYFSSLKGKIIFFKTWTKEGFWQLLNKIPIIKYFGTVNLIVFKKII